MKKLFSLAAVLYLFFSFTACAHKLPVQELSITTQDGRLIKVQAETARTAQERNFGFMKRKNIPEGTGMIFIFEKDQILSFWMKNTPHPLSIAYIDSHGTIRNIFDMTPFSLSDITSTVSVRYALEVPQGWFEKNNITTGDKISLPQ